MWRHQYTSGCSLSRRGPAFSRAKSPNISSPHSPLTHAISIFQCIYFPLSHALLGSTTRSDPPAFPSASSTLPSFDASFPRHNAISRTPLIITDSSSFSGSSPRITVITFAFMTLPRKSTTLIARRAQPSILLPRTVLALCSSVSSYLQITPVSMHKPATASKDASENHRLTGFC